MENRIELVTKGEFLTSLSSSLFYFISKIAMNPIYELLFTEGMQDWTENEVMNSGEDGNELRPMEMQFYQESELYQYKLHTLKLGGLPTLEFICYYKDFILPQAIALVEMWKSEFFSTVESRRDWIVINNLRDGIYIFYSNPSFYSPPINFPNRLNHSLQIGWEKVSECSDPKEEIAEKLMALFPHRFRGLLSETRN